MDDYRVIEILESMNAEFFRLTNSEKFVLVNMIANFKRYLKEKSFEKIIDSVRMKWQVRALQSKPHAGAANWDQQTQHFHLRLGPNDKKIVIYSCITGQYDDPLTPCFYKNNIDYQLFTDNGKFLEKGKVNGWQVKKIPALEGNYTNSMLNRYIKFHPFELFGKDYDYAIYVDGNVRPISDLSEFVYCIDDKVGLAFHEHRERDCIYEEVKMCKISRKGNWEHLKKQAERYKKEGYPAHNGLLECNVIAVDLKNQNAKNILQQWWEEFLKSGSGRDQIALPYILWKNHIPVESLATLGHNVYRNPKLRVYLHNN